MKIAFLCGTLEQGDGVGDYTRQLAGALVQHGHEVAIAAVYDTHVTEQIMDVASTGDMTLQTMRLPSTWPSNRRVETAIAWIQEFGADWLSLQYVGFGLNQFGLPKEILTIRRLLGNTAKLHIMFHELWCGMAATAGYKEKVLGILQKGFLFLLLSKLKPSKVFTSIQPYATRLQRLGAKPQLVPIFGNIPLGVYSRESAWHELVCQLGLRPLLEEPDQWLVVGFFGTIYSTAGLRSLLQTVAQAAKQTGRKLGIISLGKNRGIAIEELTVGLDGVNLWNTGSLPVELLNHVMDLVDLGVITTLVAGLNKSGSAVAWLERGISLLVSPDDDSYVESEMMPLGVYHIKSASDVLRSLEVKKNMVKQSRLLSVSKIYSFLN